VSCHKLALYTVIYPGVERYLAPWYQSICSQIDREFDLWISLDSLRIDEVTTIIGMKPRANWLISPPHQSPATIRQKALKQFAQEYSMIVFVDSDDVLYPSRVQCAREELERHEVTACALRFMDDAGQELNITFGAALDCPLDELLPRNNVFGLSNSAYRSETLLSCFPIPDECVLIDWLLATRAWINGASMHFDTRTHMAYRQHSSNTARVLPPFFDHQVLRGTELVLRHYAAVLGTMTEQYTYQRHLLEHACARAEVFSRAINGSTKLLKDYVEALNQFPQKYVWWWFVAHPDLEDIWNP
jgi:hypothetical protein